MLPFTGLPFFLCVSQYYNLSQIIVSKQPNILLSTVSLEHLTGYIIKLISTHLIFMLRVGSIFISFHKGLRYS